MVVGNGFITGSGGSAGIVTTKYIFETITMNSFNLDIIVAGGGLYNDGSINSGGYSGGGNSSLGCGGATVVSTSKITPSGPSII